MRGAQKLSKQLAACDNGPYPSDVPNRTYEVINHKTGEATKFAFQMNSTLQKSKTTVMQKTEIPPVGKLIQGHRFNEAHYQKVMKGVEDVENQSVNSSVYSLKRHYDRKSKGKKRRSTSRK